ncbi:MAG: hypothetical protein DMF58_04550, partial [Acidobacteria bacterium]
MGNAAPFFIFHLKFEIRNFQMVPNHRFPRFPLALITLGVLCLLTGSYLGLFVAPPEHYMGNVQRI